MTILQGIAYVFMWILAWLSGVAAFLFVTIALVKTWADILGIHFSTREKKPNEPDGLFVVKDNKHVDPDNGQAPVLKDGYTQW